MIDSIYPDWWNPENSVGYHADHFPEIRWRAFRWDTHSYATADEALETDYEADKDTVSRLLTCSECSQVAAQALIDAADELQNEWIKINKITNAVSMREFLNQWLHSRAARIIKAEGAL